MTRFLLMPDLEAVVRTAIAGGGFRCYSSIPNNPVWPLCVVSRSGGTSAVRQYLDTARIQVDVWGGAKGDPTPVPKSVIQDMAQEARIAILELEGQKVLDPVPAFISAVDDATGLMWLPDDLTGRDRYLFTMLVWGRSLLPAEETS